MFETGRLLNWISRTKEGILEAEETECHDCENVLELYFLSVRIVGEECGGVNVLGEHKSKPVLPKFGEPEFRISDFLHNKLGIRVIEADKLVTPVRPEELTLEV